MEWKKDNTDSEKLRQMEKEYMEEALRMMKRAGISETNVTTPPVESKEKVNKKLKEELHNEPEEISEETAVTEEETEETSEEENITEESMTEEIYEEISDTEIESEVIPDIETESGEAIEADEASEEQQETEKKEEDEDDKQKGEYGVYTADEILSGEGVIDAERIIEEIKMQNETMKKLTEEQEKAAKQPRTCPKCGRIIDGPA